MFLTLTFNTTAKARTETLHGREYFVAPAVMMTEGVHSGSQGPVLYTTNFLSKRPELWNHKPLVVYHPKDAHGTHNSAADAKIMESHGIGFVLNARYDTKGGKGRWPVEVWADKEQTKKVDKRVYNALKDGKKMEVSTGLHLTVKKRKGTWDGQKYSMVALNYVPDHLAVLPDEEGACSVKKGAGLLVNALFRQPKDRRKKLTVNDKSFQDISLAISQALSKQYSKPGYSWNGYLRDVFDTYFVYCVYGTGYGSDGGYDAKMYRQDYTVGADDSIEFSGDPVEVAKQVKYVPVSNASTTNSEEGKVMAKKFVKKDHIDSLIGNGFEEADRAWLEKLEDDNLKKIAAKPITVPVENANDLEEDEEEEEVPKKKKVVTANTKTKAEPAEKKVTLRELLANADPEDRQLFEDMRLSHQRERSQLTQTITANAANPYDEEELKGMDLKNLRKLAKLCQVQNAKEDDDEERPHFLGMGGITANTNEGEELSLDAPALFPAK